MSPPIREWKTHAEGARHFVAGTLAGMLAVWVGHPLDSLKVRMQTNPHLRGSPLTAARTIVAKEGLRALFSGLSPALAGVLVNSSLFYGTFGVVADLLSKNEDREYRPLSLPKTAFAGAVTGFVTSFTLCPFEVIKCRMQNQRLASSGLAVHATAGNQQQIYTSSWHCAQSLWRTRGLSGLYRGLGITLARELPASSVFFTCHCLFNSALRRMCGLSESQSLPLPLRLLSGGLTGLSLWLTVYPLDVVKSRIQVGEEGGALRIARDMFSQGGLRAFYRGLGPVSVRAFLVAGVSLTTYDLTSASLLRWIRSL